MKKFKNRYKSTLLLCLQLCGMLLFTQCSNLDETITTDIDDENSILITDAWICNMQSFEEDYWRYELYMQDNGDYIAISDSRLLKVSSAGTLDAMIILNYDDDNDDIIKIYDDKIYRFHTENEFQNFDPNLPVKLDIYDLDFILQGEYELDTKGLIYDVEIESDEVFGLLSYNVDASTMTLKKVHLNSGLLAEQVLSTTGTSPTNLHIADTGDYFCTASSTRNNFVLLDNDLNILLQEELDQFIISDAKYIPGQGYYIAGRMSTFVDPDKSTYVALVDEAGSVLNTITFDSQERWSPYMQINSERICLVQTEPESSKNMLMSLLDHDLEIQSTIEIPGNKVQSPIINNEIGSFSFVYGIAIDPDAPDFVPASNTRIFKFDDTYELPTNVIIQ